MPLSHNHLIRIGHLAQFGVGRPCSEENFTNLGGGIHVWKMPWQWDWNFRKSVWWLSKDYFFQGVGAKGKVCWCECWQIARRCRTFELPSSSGFRLTAPDFFQRTGVQSQGRDGPAQGLTMWVRRPYYEFTAKRLRQHVRVQSTPQLEDGLNVWLAINVSQILFDRRRSKPNTISEQPQWFDTLSQCDKITHSSSKEKNSSNTLLVKN